MKFGVKNKKFDTFKILTRFEELAQNLKEEKINKNLTITNSMIDPKDDFMPKLLELSKKFMNHAKTAQNNLSTIDEKTLYNLKGRVKDEKLIITKADKENGVHSF